MIQQFVQADVGQNRFGWTGEPQDLTNQGINPRQLAASQLHQILVWMFFQKQIEKSLSDHQRIFDFVGHPGGKRADTGQPVELPQILLEAARGCKILKYHGHG